MKKLFVFVIILFLASCSSDNVEKKVTVSENLIVEALTFADANTDQYGQILTIYDRRTHNYGQYNSFFNIEHIYPDSLLSTNEEKRDLYNLRFATISINSQRANLPFVDIDGGGSYGIIRNGFYPGDDDKGDVARTLMYMAHTYDLKLSDMIDEDIALKWHEEDPVDEFERHRAGIIKAIQGNENPFIEDSNYAKDIYRPNRTLLWIVIGVGVLIIIGYQSEKEENKKSKLNT